MTKRERKYHNETFPNAVMGLDGFYVSKLRGKKKKWVKDFIDVYGTLGISPLINSKSSNFYTPNLVRNEKA